MQLIRGCFAIMALALLAYTAVCAAAYVWQERLVYAPDRVLAGRPAELGIDYRELRLPTSDGETLHAWYRPAPQAGKTVLLLHGNGGNISRYRRTLEVFQDLDHGLLAVDYRGYGESSGTPTETGTYIDALSAYEHLVEVLGVAPRDIIVYGRSLGGAVATWLAVERPPAGLILESTFTRLADIGALRYPWLPTDWLTRIEYDSLARMPRIRCPVLVAHGRADTTVPADFGRALAEAPGAKREFVSLPGGHNDAFLRGGPAYYARLDRFIRAVGEH